nr:hypothetical protein [Entomoplasma sp. MP1]
MNNKINFNKDNYLEFNDFNDVMIRHLELVVRFCYEPNKLVLCCATSKTIGTLIKEQNKNLTDNEVET